MNKQIINKIEESKNNKFVKEQMENTTTNIKDNKSLTITALTKGERHN